MCDPGNDPVFPPNAQEIRRRLHEFAPYLYNHCLLWSCDEASQIITDIDYDFFSKNEAVKFECISRSLAESIALGKIEYVESEGVKMLKPETVINWAISQGYQIPDCIQDQDKEFPGGVKCKVEHPETAQWKAKAWEIGTIWMNEQRQEGKDPGVDAIAKFVAGELRSLNIRSVQGKFLNWQTIKRDALTGITGRPPNGKNQKRPKKTKIDWGTPQ